MDSKLSTSIFASAALIALSGAASAADFSNGDYPILTNPAPVSAWNVWGDASLALEYYAEPSFNYDETDIEGRGRALFRLGNGLNVQLTGFAGQDIVNNVTFGSVSTDIFFATPDHAAGIYAGVFANTDGFSDFFMGIEGAKFFTTVDVGGWAGWQTGNQNAEAGVWFMAYLSPNTGIGGAGFWEGNSNYNRFSAGWRLEHRMTDTQWSVWTDGNISHFTGFSDDFTSYDARLGLTFFFDPRGTTLQEHNHMMPF